MGVSTRKVLSALGRVGTVALVAVIFALGLTGTIYLSLRSPETQVPEVVNKRFSDGEATLEKSGLGIRERARRFKPDVEPGVILDQSPRPGEVVKVGQTVAVVVSRAAKEGEKGFGEVPSKEEKEAAESASKNGNAANSSPNRNENRERRGNRNTNGNRNGNTNGNLNASGNRNANNQNSNAGSRNANLNAANRNAGGNRNGNATPDANRNRNANARNANGNAGRNTNTGRTNTNAGRSNSNNANKRPANF